MSKTIGRRWILGLPAALAMSAWADEVKEIRLDYATYSPISLVIRKMGWMEDEFKADNVRVKWVFSQSSANALDFLKKGSLDFASSAGLAAVLARTAGASIKSVYVFSKPDWAALAVVKDSPIGNVQGLKGKRIAATPGTDPYIFVMRMLEAHGMRKSDVQMVPLNHVLGRKALEAGEVDAWSALDPHQAASELEAGSRILYRNPEFCSYGVLNVTEAFARASPQTIRRVLKVYERGRNWAMAHPSEVTDVMVEEGKLSPGVARLQLKRNDFSNPVPGAVHVKALKAGVSALVAEHLVPSTAIANQAIESLIDGSFMTGRK